MRESKKYFFVDFLAKEIKGFGGGNLGNYFEKIHSDFVGSRDLRRFVEKI